jgi:hypothetical protein
MKITTIVILGLSFISSFSFSQKDSSNNHLRQIKSVKPKVPKQKIFRSFVAFGASGVTDFKSHQIGNAFRLIIVSNKRLQITNELSNYSRFNYDGRKANIHEKELAVSLNYGYSQVKRFYIYGITGIIHREVKVNEIMPNSNKCNSFLLGTGVQLNFKHISTYVESKIIKQDYSANFIGLLNPGDYHSLLTAGVNIHPKMEIEKYRFRKKMKKSKIMHYRNLPVLKTNKKVVNCSHF